jgi:uncharacterized protein YjiS (DUF1127 family)
MITHPDGARPPLGAPVPALLAAAVEPRRPPAGGPWLRSRLLAALRRASERGLADLDDRLLADAGIRPEQVPGRRAHDPPLFAARTAMDLPFWPGLRGQGGRGARP